MRYIPHPVVLQQIAAPQPKLIIVLLCLFVPGWLPTLLTHTLILWPRLSTFTSEHDFGYRLTFFFVQFSLICGAMIFVTMRYSSAIWTPQPAWKRGIGIAAFTLLPIFIYYLTSSVSGIQGAVTLSSLGGEGRQTLASLHEEVWGQLAYGPSLEGVICSSITSFSAPVLEEVIFSGFVVNAIGRRCGWLAGVVADPTCFALVHAIQFGFGSHLLPLFFAGLTYVVIRVASGSLLLAVVAHCTINAVIFLPKWVIAVIHFTQV